MADEGREDEAPPEPEPAPPEPEPAPPEPEPAPPEEPQTSVHAQTVEPEPATSDAPPEPAERTLAEESLRRRASEEEGDATEHRRDEA